MTKTAETREGDPRVEHGPPDAESTIQKIAAALQVKAGVHSHGMIGGIGIRCLDFQVLQRLFQEADGRPRLAAAVRGQVERAMQRAGISYGVQDDALSATVEEFVQSVAAGEQRIVAHRIALGEAPHSGDPAHIEYALNYRGKAFRELAGLDDTSNRRHCTVVNAEDVIATLRPPVAPRKGITVRGENVEPPTVGGANPPTLEQIAGDNTRIDGTNLLASCDGVCEESAQGQLRVIAKIQVPRVDQVTGRVPETGISGANVLVEGSITGAGVATTESLFVGTGESGGGIDGRCSVQAGNLVVAGRIVGESGGRLPPLEVDGLMAASEVLNRQIDAGRILVRRDCQFAQMECEEDARVDGSLRGGQIRCHALLRVVGDLGTAGEGSKTIIILPAHGVGERRRKKITAAAHRYRDQQSELQRQTEELDKRAEKRAKADGFWASLLQGERHHPKTRMQTRALQQFVEFLNAKRTLSRQIKGVKEALVRLSAQLKGLQVAARQQSATVTVGGTLFLDVGFEIVREMTADDDDLSVRFEHDGNEYLRSTLGKAKGILTRQVRQYCEQQNLWLEEKKAAINKMFEGQEKRPSAPDIEDKTFELPVVFLDTEECPELRIAAVLTVKAREPGKIFVRTAARVAEPQRNVTVEMRAEGARGCFSLQRNATPPVPWQRDEAVREQLNGMIMGSISAAAVLGLP